MHVLIVGGGIGGLATALSLHAVGIQLHRLQQDARAARTRRRHQHVAARDQGADGVGLLPRSIVPASARAS